MGRCFARQPIDEGEHLRYGFVKRGWNFLAELYLRQQLSESGVSIQRDAMFFGSRQDLFGDRAATLCGDARRARAIIAQGDRHGRRDAFFPGHAFRSTSAAPFIIAACGGSPG